MKPLTLIALILLAGFGSASLSIEPESIKACSCGSTELSTLVKNESGSEQLIELTSSASKGWASVEESSFYLSNNKSKEVRVLVDVPCEEGEFNVSVKSGNEEASSLVESVNCSKYSASLPEKVVTCGGFNRKIPLTVKNESGTASNFTLSLEENPLASLERTELFIPGNSSKTAFLIVTAPLEAESEARLSVSVKAFGDSIEKESVLSVKPCYGLSAVLETESLSGCSGKPVDSFVEIYNTGQEDNVVTISGERVHVNKIAVKPGKSQKVAFTIEYPSPGLYAPSIKLSGRGFEDMLSMSFNSLDCNPASTTGTSTVKDLNSALIGSAQVETEGDGNSVQSTNSKAGLNGPTGFATLQVRSALFGVVMGLMVLVVELALVLWKRGKGEEPAGRNPFKQLPD